MAARARLRLRATEVLCRDITVGGGEVEGKYELITAFRFFLNAEPGLRVAALAALAARLQDDRSLLVFNNHGNILSVKIIGWPYHRLRRIGRGWQPRGNYLRHGQVKQLLAGAGLRIVRVIGLGVLGGKLFSCLRWETGLRWERRLSASPVVSRFGQDQIYVVCRQAEKSRVN